MKNAHNFIALLAVHFLTMHSVEASSLKQSTSKSTGTITGAVYYPSEAIPAQKLCAQSTINPYLLNCIDISYDQERYSINVKPGTYYVFTSEAPYGSPGMAVYHTRDDVVSRFDNPAPGTIVKVNAGRTLSDVDINNWFACGAPGFRRFCIWDK